MVRRLQLHHMWPPERPAVKIREKVWLPVHPTAPRYSAWVSDISRLSGFHVERCTIARVPSVDSVHDALMQDFYWVHLEHEREVVVKLADPATRNREAIANLEPRVHDDNRSGLRETRFRVLSIEPFLNATRVVVQLACNRQLTPWCDKW